MSFCHFWPPMQKYFWPTPGKSNIGPFLEIIPPASMFRGTRSSIEMLKGCTDGECVETPDVEDGIGTEQNATL